MSVKRLFTHLDLPGISDDGPYVSYEDYARLESALRRARPYVYNAEVADSADLEARWLALNEIDSVLGLSTIQSCYENPSQSDAATKQTAHSGGGEHG